MQAARQWLLRNRPELAAKFEFESKKKFLHAYNYSKKKYRLAKAMHNRTGGGGCLVPEDLYELLCQAFELADNITSVSILTIPLPTGMVPAVAQSSAPSPPSHMQPTRDSVTTASLRADATAGGAAAARSSAAEGRMLSDLSARSMPAAAEASSSVSTSRAASPSASGFAGNSSSSAAPTEMRRRRTSQFMQRAEALADVLERRFGGNSRGSSETASIMKSAVAEFLAQGERHHAETMAVLRAWGHTSGGQHPSPHGWPQASSAPPSHGWPQVSSAPPSHGWPQVSSVPPSHAWPQVSSAPPSHGWPQVSSAPPSHGWPQASTTPQLLGRPTPVGGQSGGVSAAAIPAHNAQFIAQAAPRELMAPASVGSFATPVPRRDTSAPRSPLATVGAMASAVASYASPASVFPAARDTYTGAAPTSSSGSSAPGPASMALRSSESIGAMSIHAGLPGSLAPAASAKGGAPVTSYPGGAENPIINTVRENEASV